MKRAQRLAPVIGFCLLLGLADLGWSGHNQKPTGGFQAHVPKMWDDAALSSLEVPLANPIGSPKHVSADYYYKIPVRPIYKEYPVYAPGHEPPGYMEWLKGQEPVILWDDKGHAPPLKTEADWIKAGELVFEASPQTGGVMTVDRATSPEWWAKIGAPTGKDGVLPGYHYLISEKGKIELGDLSCASCHSRVMPDGTVLKGAQGNFPFDHNRALELRSAAADDPTRKFAGLVEISLFRVPWLKDDVHARMLQMSSDEIAAVHDSIPAGVMARHRASPFYPVQIPDLIGVRDRRYLDRTGLQQHRSIVDLVRYAALNQGGDDLASYDGFIPADFPNFKTLDTPDKAGFVFQGRYSDEQLYALALYVYSLKPPPNPNKFDARAARGRRVFEKAGCANCHTPPLYTNNKLTLAEGFTPPAGASQRYDIMPISVGTDPNLALKTRRGTGYYKVPSLKGVWYR
ncbi:MAG TPA: hypothetical protein VGZ29_06095, partial [Terriglobia bacterium]|nr:hypothetical protein [Terriglobia bacterium]